MPILRKHTGIRGETNIEVFFDLVCATREIGARRQPSRPGSHQESLTPMSTTWSLIRLMGERALAGAQVKGAIR